MECRVSVWSVVLSGFWMLVMAVHIMVIFVLMLWCNGVVTGVVGCACVMGKLVMLWCW